MEWKKIVMAVLLGALSIFVGMEVFGDFKEYKKEAEEAENLKAEVLNLREENEKTRTDIEYYSDPYNLEKELKSKYNYKREGEKMMIVVPKDE